MPVLAIVDCFFAVCRVARTFVDANSVLCGAGKRGLRQLVFLGLRDDRAAKEIILPRL